MAIINRETDYAIRILRTLSDGERHSIADICERECMQKPFTYKIGKKLDRSGIIEITRGPEGGCVLSRDLTELNLYELMQAIDDSQVLIDCMKDDYGCEYCDTKGCRVHGRMTDLQGRINDVLMSCSISDLLE